ncbi:transcriptional repressor NrdR [archaeon]|jgi:transcriptional repressor NrdR|nr:transcriptional repressor NrdR [archaeon]MBT6182613.1 transcriptional repressor NrdR [archaeon]MBT6606227.1 transcriptional repressor NrdR [archaeon]MBT7251604.1 transcriptional repressor NrdR [archaeon]MBT7660845.1 transcriptional repressor NrdR [archaeon]
MICPYCSNSDTKVTDKRDSNEITRRRRECLKCEKRFTTYERVELDLNVTKKDGKRERFNRDKLFVGVSKNLEKRPFTTEQVEKIVSDIVARIYRFAKDKDIPSAKIGEIVMAELKKVDKIAYVRFASVYRDFADIEDFRDELRDLK